MMMNSLDDDRYVLADQDKSIIFAATDLLWNIVRSKYVSARQLGPIALVLAVLERMPKLSEPLDVLIELSGPRRWYGEHEIWHWWELRVEDRFVEISSGGHFYRKSTGGDSFSSMQWAASPGVETEFNDYLYALSIVDDAAPFESEVLQMDLSEDGYSLTVSVDGEKIHCGDYSDDDQESEETDDFEHVSNDLDDSLGPQKKTAGLEESCHFIQNKWTGEKAHFSIPPLPGRYARKSGACFQPGTFDKKIGEEIALIVFDDPEFARELGILNPFNLRPIAGFANTTQGVIAYVIWVISSSGGDVVDYEQLLNPFHDDTLKLVDHVAQQTHLKVLIVDSYSSEVTDLREFENTFGMDLFAASIAKVIATEPVADFAATQQALHAEYSLTDLKGPGPEL